MKRGAPEAELKRRIRLALARVGAVTWTNPVGQAITPTGHPVRYGLCDGSSDLIGIAPGGAFLAIEVKRPGGGTLRPGQQEFVDLVRMRGGIAGIVRSVDEALALVTTARLAAPSTQTGSVA